MKGLVEIKGILGLSSFGTTCTIVAVVAIAAATRLPKVFARRRMVSAVLCARAAVDVVGLAATWFAVEALVVLPVSW